MGFLSQHLLSSLRARGAEGRLGVLPVPAPGAGRGPRRLSRACGPALALKAYSISLSPVLLGGDQPSLYPRASPSPTHVLASLPPYIRWASFSSSMSQYLLQNSVTSLPWSFTAFMGG